MDGWFNIRRIIPNEASVSAYPCQNKREISASKKCGSGWDRSRVRGYFKKKSKSSRNTRRKYA